MAIEEVLDAHATPASVPLNILKVEEHLQRIGDRYGKEIDAVQGEIVRTLMGAEGLCREGFDLCDKLWRDLGWKNLSKEEFAQRTGKIVSIYNRLTSNAKLLSLIDQGVQTSLYMLHKGDLPPQAERTPEDHRRVVDRYRTFYADALETIEQDLRIAGGGAALAPG